jgi:putative hydrolase of the HAD superfamily
MLAAVLFDLDNTLIDRDRAFNALLLDTFDVPAARAAIERVDAHGQGGREALFLAWEKHGGGRMDQECLAAEIAARLVPDEALLAGLRNLADRVKIGILTNGASQGQRCKLRAAALDQVVMAEHIWISGEVGCSKPSPDSFLRACHGLAVDPASTLYIGDHAPHDSVGPAAAGLRHRLVSAPLTAETLAHLLSEEMPL